MSNEWIIDRHHIAIDAGNELLHPSAQEIFSFVTGNNLDRDIQNPIQVMHELRFSKIGVSIKIEVYNNEEKIMLDLYVIKNKHKWPVDIVEGHILDHCVTEKEWLYINNDVAYLQELIDNAEIKDTGQINIGQYINLIKQEYFSDRKEIIDNVDKEIFSTLMIPEGDVPDGLNANLYEYQKNGYLWMKMMMDISKGCILGDEMGLGKTLQVISLFQYMKNIGRMPVLVIAPVSLLENWKRECEKFAPQLSIYVHQGAKRTGRAKELLKYDVTVLSYNTACSDLSMLRMIDWECVVLDEAQNIKNPYSERAKSVKAITRKRSIAITGTPFENHITDIWSLMDYVIPDLLGSLSTFTDNVSDDILGAKKIEPIISPVMIRRMVKDVANDLPEKVIISQPIEMSDDEKRYYRIYQQQEKDKISGDFAASLAILQKLRMFCTHPYLCSEDLKCDFIYKNPEEYSIKYQRFCEIVEEVLNRKEKLIVFTSYKKMFEMFQKDIPVRFGIELDFINGETPVDQRQKIVDWFNNYEGSAMLVLNPRAAGTGLNITGANHVIHYNLEWNPSLEDQASARAYRRGQNKTVFIYRLYYIDTVEQIVNERIERKREIGTAAIVGTDGVTSEQDDILKALEMIPEISQKG